MYNFKQDSFSKLISKKSKIQVINIKNQQELKKYFQKISLTTTSEKNEDSINIENLNDHWVQGNDYGFSKQWDDWSFAWSGVQVNDDNLIKSRKNSRTSNTV